MVLGFLGLPNSGKTTIYNTLTGDDAEVGYVHRDKLNIATVEVEDTRILRLKELYKPKKITFPSIEVYDFAKLDEDRESYQLLETKLLDVIAIVLRFFDDDVVNEEEGRPDPERDLRFLESEFIISDLIIAEKRLEKIRLNLKRGVKNNDLLLEEKLLEKIIASLNQNIPVRSLNISKEEEPLLRSWQLLSGKPVVLILNSDEEGLEKAHELENNFLSEGYPVCTVAGKYEMELLKLDETDRELFLHEIGSDTFAKNRIIEAAYKALNYIHFFTVGDKEVRAWTVKKGVYAPEAAGKIHSDMEKGFIRAECFHYDDLMECGSEKALKEKGKFRLEGKNYQVKDGDILIIRFNK